MTIINFELDHLSHLVKKQMSMTSKCHIYKPQTIGKPHILSLFLKAFLIYEPWHDISNIVVCATSDASDQPWYTGGSLIRAFASRLNVLWVLTYWLNIRLKGGCTGSSESTLSKSHIVGNHTSWLKFNIAWKLMLESLYSYSSTKF